MTVEEKGIVKKVRAYLETKVEPIINKYWSNDAFPFEPLPSFKELQIGGLGVKGYGCIGGSQKLFGFVAMELARVDPSICTFFGVHNGLAMGSIYLDGSEEQKKKWLPPMARWEKIGCFGLTEPLAASGTSGGMTTTAKREGDTWILNGQKRWIGNAPWCDVWIIWARDVADNQVKGFIVENKTTPGFTVEKIEDKIALKVVQNGQITLKNVRVPEVNRLQGGNPVRDTSRVLRRTRYMVGWASTGVQIGVFEATLKYAQERSQFGKPIASFQMVEDLLAKMLANVTACQCLMVRLAQMDDEGKLGDQHATLAQAFCTAKSRETLAWGRELLRGNGIVADCNVARFFADTEALYSYAPEPTTHRIHDARLRRALDHISAKLDEEITLAQLAQVAGLSVFHFAHTFTRAMGVSPSRYVSRVRLEKAMAEIAAGKLSLAEIAFKAGFSSQASFTRAFYRTTGLTPGEYRTHRVSDLPGGSFGR